MTCVSGTKATFAFHSPSVAWSLFNPAD